MLKNAFSIYYNCLSNYSHKTNRDNRINSSLLKKKVLIDYCSCPSIQKQINEKLTACESWKIAGTQPCLTADLDLLYTVLLSSQKSNAKIVPTVKLSYY